MSWSALVSHPELSFFCLSSMQAVRFLFLHLHICSVEVNVALQLLMETAGDCRKTHARVNPSPLTHLQEVEPHVAKRRLAQARRRATLARLFSGLREAVLSQPDNSALKVRSSHHFSMHSYYTRVCLNLNRFIRMTTVSSRVPVCV